MPRTRRRLLRPTRFVAPLLAATLIVAGCLSALATLHKGAVFAEGDKGGEQQRYAFVHVELANPSLPPPPVLCIRLADDEPPLRTDQLTREHAVRVLAPFRGEGGGAGTDVFVGHGYVVEFRGEQLVALTVGGKENAAGRDPTGSGACIGPASCERLYPMPIDRAQFVEIFGEPDREESVLRV